MSDLIFLGHSTPAQDAALLKELDKALAALAAAKAKDSESSSVSVPCPHGGLGSDATCGCRDRFVSG